MRGVFVSVAWARVRTKIVLIIFMGIGHILEISCSVDDNSAVDYALLVNVGYYIDIQSLPSPASVRYNDVHFIH